MGSIDRKPPDKSVGGFRSTLKSMKDEGLINRGRGAPRPPAAGERQSISSFNGTELTYEWGQHCPFFFTREKAEHLGLIGSFRGASAFLIGSGPSFSEVNKELLRRAGVWTMTINNSIKSFRSNANICVDEPQRFSLSTFLDPTVMKFVPLEHMESPLFDNRMVEAEDGEKIQMWQLATKSKGEPMLLGDCPNVVGYRRNEHFSASQFLTEDTFNWGNHQNICVCGEGDRIPKGGSCENCGAPGIQGECQACGYHRSTCPKCGRTDCFGSRTVFLPALRVLYLLGFRKVYLVGVDFDMSPEKKYHFEEERHQGAINNNNSTYEKLKIWLSDLRPYFDAARFRVFNTNMNSKLEVFDKIPFSDAIKRATAHIGFPAEERTQGMYAGLIEKTGVTAQIQRIPLPDPRRLVPQPMIVPAAGTH